jgi:hypothetical protein
VLKYLLLDYVGWWAPVCCGMSVHCVLKYLLLDYVGWWAPVCEMSQSILLSHCGSRCVSSLWLAPPSSLCLRHS